MTKPLLILKSLRIFLMFICVLHLIRVRMNYFAKNTGNKVKMCKVGRDIAQNTFIYEWRKKEFYKVITQRLIGGTLNFIGLNYLTFLNHVSFSSRFTVQHHFVLCRSHKITECIILFHCKKKKHAAGADDLFS